MPSGPGTGTITIAGTVTGLPGSSILALALSGSIVSQLSPAMAVQMTGTNTTLTIPLPVLQGQARGLLLIPPPGNAATLAITQPGQTAIPIHTSLPTLLALPGTPAVAPQVVVTGTVTNLTAVWF